MRYPAEHKQETRKRILRAAARRIRSRGSQGAAIGDLMRDLHLTHGGFLHRVATALQRAPKGGEIKALIDTYLDIEHCDNAADGCPVAALATELARRPARSRARLAFEKRLIERTRKMAEIMPGSTAEERERTARMLMSGMSGTLTIGRVITDENRRRKFLDDA